MVYSVQGTSRETLHREVVTDFFYGQSSSGKCVTERSAMQMTAVYACVRILSEAVAGLPLHLCKWGDSGSKEKAVEHPLYFLLHDEPNKEMLHLSLGKH